MSNTERNESPKRQNRVLPPNYRFLVEFTTFRKLTLVERLKALFGYRVKVITRIATEHSPGKWHPKQGLLLTTQLEAETPSKIQS